MPLTFLLTCFSRTLNNKLRIFKNNFVNSKFQFHHFQTYNLLPPPESSKSRHAKQLKPPDDNYASTAAISSSSDNLNKNKTKATADDNWLNSSDVMKLGKTNQTSDNENRNGLKLSTSVTAASDIVAPDDNLMQSTPTTLTATSSASHYIDAFSDLDPLGTGKIRPYIDKKYFFQDLKNPPKKVLKDLSDRDGFSTSFTSEPKSTSDFSVFQENSNIDNTLQDSRKKSEQSDEFVAQFPSNTQIFSPNNNGTHGTPPNLLRSDNGKFLFQYEKFFFSIK